MEPRHGFHALPCFALLFFRRRQTVKRYRRDVERERVHSDSEVLYSALLYSCSGDFFGFGRSLSWPRVV
jgi:hypothetical protein